MSASVSTAGQSPSAETDPCHGTLNSPSTPDQRNTREPNIESNPDQRNIQPKNDREPNIESNPNQPSSQPKNDEESNIETKQTLCNVPHGATDDHKADFNLNPIKGEVTAASNGSAHISDEVDCGQVSSDDSERDIHRSDTSLKFSSLPDFKQKRQSKSFRKSFGSLFSCAGGRADHAEEGVRTIDNILDAYIDYNHDSQEPGRPHGRGICVMFTLFTGDSIGRGYNSDKQHLCEFFGQKLRYKLFCDGDDYVNVTREQLLKTLEHIQAEIKDKAQQKKPYDRFVLVILTHGEQDGLMTCANSNGNCEELSEYVDEEGKSCVRRVYTKVEDICSMFKHDKVPDLKGKPKLFLVQACRGNDTVRSASSSDHQQMSYDLGKLNLRPEIPIDADQIVFYASTPDFKSYVAPSGSWFIDTTLAVFKRHCKSMHVEEMMTLINFVIANKVGKELVSKTMYKDAVQMPCKHSTLRMKFYL